MSVTSRLRRVAAPRPLSGPVSYEPPGLGRLRKIALIGTAGTWAYAPFHDPSWEIWAHSSAIPLCPRVDRIFDLHPKTVWQKKKSWHKHYQRFLRECPVPIYMHQHYKEIPQSIRFPREQILSEFRRYFSSQAAWMMALALTEGVTHLGFFGIHYAFSAERTSQRHGCEYWMGFCEGRGVQLVIPPGCPLLHEPKLLYGYENYDASGKQIGQPSLKEPVDVSALTVVNMNDPVGRTPLMTPPEGIEVAWERSGHAHRV